MNRIKYAALLLAVSMLLSSGVFAQSFHGASSSVRPNYDSLYTAAIELSQSTDGKALLEKCFARYGGREKLAQLSSFKIKVEMENHLMHAIVPVEKSFSRGRQYRITNFLKEGTETRILSGSTSWFVGRDTVVEMQDLRTRIELFRYFALSMPLGLETEKASSVKYGLRANDSLGFFYMKMPDSMMVVVGIHSTDHTVRSVEGILEKNGKPYVYSVSYSDFKETDGYLFPYTSTTFSLGLKVADSRIKELEINPSFGPDEFKPAE